MIGETTTLDNALRAMVRVTVAVSGGVDSLTLACAARRVLGAASMRAVHAISPAVPADTTARVRAMAEAHDWPLR